jgi:hypothetical protein
LPLPDPEPGLVIPYAYLWRHEHRKGQEEGRKVRPAVIVLAVQPAKNGPPARHRSRRSRIRRRLGAARRWSCRFRVKQALGLDDERSWIILDEVNQFSWPGYDLRPVPGAKDRFAYGFVPPKLYEAVIARILTLAAERRVAQISRD